MFLQREVKLLIRVLPWRGRPRLPGGVLRSLPPEGQARRSQARVSIIWKGILRCHDRIAADYSPRIPVGLRLFYLFGCESGLYHPVRKAGKSAKFATVGMETQLALYHGLAL